MYFALTSSNQNTVAESSPPLDVDHTESVSKMPINWPPLRKERKNYCLILVGGSTYVSECIRKGLSHHRLFILRCTRMFTLLAVSVCMKCLSGTVLTVRIGSHGTVLLS